MKPELRTQGPHGAPSSGPGCHEDPACVSFPVDIDRGARGLLFSIKWEKVTMVRKWGLLSKDFQNLGSLVMGSPGGEGGAQSSASQAGDRGVQSRGSVCLYRGLGLGLALLSSLVVMPKKGKKWDGLKIQPQRLVASWEAWVHSVTGELLTSGSLQALGSQAPTEFGVEPKDLQGISHARGQREVPSPGPSREASWGPLPVSPSVLYPLGPHQHNQFLGVLGHGGVRWPRLTSLPKPAGDWLMLLQGREAWGHQGDGPHSWQGKEFPRVSGCQDSTALGQLSPPGHRTAGPASCWGAGCEPAPVSALM